MRNILLATDGSEHSLRGAQYVAELYEGASGVDVSILTISPTIPPIYREEAHDPAIRKQFAAWKKKREEQGKENIGAATKVLVKGGMKKSRIKGKHEHQLVGVARDIVREADAGQFDACVVGKKGMGWFGSTFLGSITDKLLEISEDRPVWLVEGKKWKPRKILIAMDETEHTLELAHYVGTMLEGLEGVEMLFYHYCFPFTEDLSAQERKKLKDAEERAIEREKEEMSHFFDEAKQLLLDLGFEDEKVTYEFHVEKSAKPKRVTQAILEKLKKGGYGTLVIGRKGATHAREFRLGSVAMRIVAESKDCAVWVV